MVIVKFSNIFVTSNHLSDSLKRFQYNKIFFLRERSEILNLFINISIVMLHQILLKIYYSKEYLKSFWQFKEIII